MTNPLHDIIRKQVLEPELRKRIPDLRGVIVQYDNKTNAAVVEVPNPHGKGRQRIGPVPVQLPGGGSHSAGPFVGDQVIVSFLGGNPNYPRITAFFDEGNTKTRSKLRGKRKGTYVPNFLSGR